MKEESKVQAISRSRAASREDFIFLWKSNGSQSSTLYNNTFDRALATPAEDRPTEKLMRAYNEMHYAHTATNTDTSSDNSTQCCTY
ncbi:hypothetical protein AYL99_02123 [Fonsecaea erecta]|uniref:Uncharacterized protein n=1 Tax=Fonsecaea erecta TaxID=1367422 RepID=A0A178ZTT9_9EURO|nr:hypothetical protein AYL99_02123 [Fonsecaea erecta]OAP62896.1 hypothetical protein AYL99_02123 [Fonsecaea erecta]